MLEAGATFVSRFAVTGPDPNVADPSSEQVVLTISQPQGNHNGGWIGFSPLDGGGVCIPSQPIKSLTWDTTPTPMTCHSVVGIVDGNPVPIEQLFDMMAPAAQVELMAFYRAEAEVRKVALSHQSYANPKRGWGAKATASSEIASEMSETSRWALSSVTSAAEADAIEMLPAIIPASTRERINKEKLPANIQST